MVAVKRRVTPELVESMNRLAWWAVRRHRVPAGLRHDAAAEARVEMLAAWLSYSVESPAGLGQVAWRAVRSFTVGWKCGLSADRTRGMRVGLDDVPLVCPVDMSPEALGPSELVAPPMTAEAVSAEASQVGEVLVEVTDRLTARGMDAEVATAAVRSAALVLCAPRAGRIPGGGSERQTPAARVVEASGIDLWAARALLVLLGGVRSSGTAGLVRRAVEGDDVWHDRRVMDLLDEVVHPYRAVPRGAWDEAPAVPVAVRRRRAEIAARRRHHAA